MKRGKQPRTVGGGKETLLVPKVLAAGDGMRNVPKVADLRQKFSSFDGTKKGVTSATARVLLGFFCLWLGSRLHA
ncbi:hypothetical protein SESBI_40761, partial [Sesbania bispinosa]